jgi:hypothetical protein
MPHSFIMTTRGHVFSSTSIKQIISGGEKEIMGRRKIFRPDMLETATFMPFRNSSNVSINLGKWLRGQ